MLHLMIEAKNGHEYQAAARLEDASGGALATGVAVLAAREGYIPVAAGQYLLADVREFPSSDPTRHEWGRFGLMFKANNHRHSEAVILHGGEMRHQGRSRAVYGSIRVDDGLLQALLQQVQRPGRPMLLLTVRVSQKPSAWRFWDQPDRDTRVNLDDDGVDVFDDYWPELRPYRNPNSALAWASYFEEQGEPRETEETQDSRDSQDSQRTQPDRRDEPLDAIAPLAPLFAVSPPSGVDSFGRITDAELSSAPPSTECSAPGAADSTSLADGGMAADTSMCADTSTESTTSY